MKTTIEMTAEGWYKLRLMGVSIEGPYVLFCDNISAVINSKNPELLLHEKYASVFCKYKEKKLQQRLFKLHRIRQLQTEKTS